MFDATDVDWDEVRLHPYHAAALHKKITRALKSKKPHNTIDFEPIDVWNKLQTDGRTLNLLSSQEIDTASKCLREFLEKFADDSKASVKEDADNEMSDNEALSVLQRIRAVDITEYEKEWDQTSATDTDQQLLAIYNAQTSPNSFVAKQIRNLLIVSLRVHHHMPVRVIAERVCLSSSRVNAVLKSLSSQEINTPEEVLRQCKALTRRTLIVKKLIGEMIDGGRGLLNVPHVKKKLAEDDGIHLTYYQVKRVMTKEMDLVYRKVGTFEPYVNSRKNIILRQQMAHHLAVNVFAAGKTVCNFDESTFTECTSRSMSYAPRGNSMSRTYKKGISTVNLFLCIIDDGTRIVQFTTGSNNQVTFCQWLFDFASFMDQRRPGWRDSHRIILDNMGGHKAAISRHVAAALRLPLTFTAPASATCCPIEVGFGLAKLQTVEIAHDTTRR